VSKNSRTRTATKQEGKIALKKAQQFVEAAKSEQEQERWDSAGLNAIHSGICAADAVLIHATGVRCASQDHENVSTMLFRSVLSFKGSPRTQLLGLLKMKNTVAYEQRLITQREAADLVTAATRFLSWATENSA
jgi:uncharacterized protein (UPF0332 family)